MDLTVWSKIATLRVPCKHCKMYIEYRIDDEWGEVWFHSGYKGTCAASPDIDFMTHTYAENMGREHANLGINSSENPFNLGGPLYSGDVLSIDRAIYWSKGWKASMNWPYKRKKEPPIVPDSLDRLFEPRD